LSIAEPIAAWSFRRGTVIHGRKGCPYAARKTCDKNRLSGTLERFRHVRGKYPGRNPRGQTNLQFLGELAEPPQGCHRRRRTIEIDKDWVDNVLAALARAAQVDLVPNQHLTISWELAGVVDVVAATGRFLKLARDALRRCDPNASIAYIWVQETGLRMGWHVHILLYAPTEHRGWFARSKGCWLRRCGAARSAW
jgi:hypothetical protein